MLMKTQKGSWRTTYNLKRISPSSLTGAQICQMSNLIHSKWAKKDQLASTKNSRNWQGSTPTPELYAEQLRQIREKGSMPIFILEDGGWMAGSLVTLRWKGALPARCKELVNNDYEGKDWQDGEPLVCRCISVSEEARGGSRALIVDGAAAYAREEMDKGRLRYLIAYSRLSDFGARGVPNGIGIAEYLRRTAEKKEMPDAGSLEQRIFYDEYVLQFGQLGMADFLRRMERTLLLDDWKKLRIPCAPSADQINASCRRRCANSRREPLGCRCLHAQTSCAAFG